MAKLTGLIKIKGTLDGVTFYKTQDGHLARMKGGVEGERIRTDPAFIRTRENGYEFGSAAAAGKLLRDTVRPMIQNASDNRLTSRLMQTMALIKGYDTTSPRGERNVGVGIADPAALQLLKGFDFNKRSILGTVLHAPYTVALATGELSFASFVPVNDLSYPAGATHVWLRSGYAIIDFAAGTGAASYSSAIDYPIDSTTNIISLPPLPLLPPDATGTKIYLLMVEFRQEVNGVQYPLKNGAYNSLSIVEVA